MWRAKGDSGFEKQVDYLMDLSRYSVYDTICLLILVCCYYYYDYYDYDALVQTASHTTLTQSKHTRNTDKLIVGHLQQLSVRPKSRSVCYVKYLCYMIKDQYHNYNIFDYVNSHGSLRSIFVDFRKAFDLVDHNILFTKLLKYNIRISS